MQEQTNEILKLRVFLRSLSFSTRDAPSLTTIPPSQKKTNLVCAVHFANLVSVLGVQCTGKADACAVCHRLIVDASDLRLSHRHSRGNRCYTSGRMTLQMAQVSRLKVVRTT